MAETQNSKQNVQAPQAGQTVIVNAIPGQDIVLEAAFDQAEVKMDGGNVVFEFANGGQVVLDFTDLGDAQAPNVVMPDGTILDMQEFLAAMGEKEAEPAAGPDGGGGEGSGGVGEYQDDAGDVIGGLDMLNGFGPRAFSSTSVEALDADNVNPLPSAGFVSAASDEDGLLREKGVTPFDGNNDEALGDNPATAATAKGFLNYDFGLDGPSATTPFTWNLAGLPSVTSQGHQVLYEVSADGQTLNGYWEFTYQKPVFDQPSDDGMQLLKAYQQESPEMETVVHKVMVFSLDLTDLQTGEYLFTLYRPLDHSESNTEDDIVYNFTFTVRDGSGDPASGGLNLIIDDDSPVPVTSEEAFINRMVDEDDILTDLSTGNRPNDGDWRDGSFTGKPYLGWDEGPANIWGSVKSLVSFGADGRGENGFSLSEDLQKLYDQGLTSQDERLEYRLVNGGMTLQAYVSGGQGDGDDLPDYELQAFRIQEPENDDRVVFELWLNSKGDYKFKLFDQLDHFDENDDSLPIDLSSAIVATDGDGDSIRLESGFVINITDDEPKLAGYDIKIVEDEAMSDGNKETWDNIFPIPPFIAQLDGDAEGSIVNDVAWGADGFGEATTFKIDGKVFGVGTTVYWGQRGNLLSTPPADDADDNGGEYLMTVKTADLPTPPAGAAASLVVNSDGSYTFTLLDNMLMGRNEQGEQMDLLDTVTVTAQDGDGDKVNVNVFLKVKDDMPVAVKGATEIQTVDEDDMSGSRHYPYPILSQGNHPDDLDGDQTDGSFTGNPDFRTGGPANVSGTVSHLVLFGADGGTFELSTDFRGLLAQGLKSQGVELKYSLADGNTLIATAGTRTVFTLDLETNGSYKFSLYDQLDHPQNVNFAENNLPINLSSVLLAIDGDGDVLKLTNGFTINVTDDAPEQVPSDAVYRIVEEESLSGGNPEWPHLPVTVSGSLASQVSFGADDVGTFVLGSTSGLAKLTSGGVEVKYTVSGDTLTAKAGSVEVFTLKLESDGDFKFTLKGPLDHEAGKGENILELNLSSVIVAKDFDGDTVTLDNDFYVEVVDDTPRVFVKETGSADLLVVDETSLGVPDSANFADNFKTTVLPGADGLLSATTTYSLSVSSSGADSGLDDVITGKNIKLYMKDGMVEGRVGGINGDVAFTVSVDSAGQVTLNQIRAIEHGNDKNPNEWTTLSHSWLVKLQQETKIVDKDGDSDTDSATISIGQALRFYDDGPTIDKTSQAFVDDEGLVPHGIKGGAGDLVVTPDVDNNEATFEGKLDFDFGADGPGSVSFAAMHNKWAWVGTEKVQFKWSSSSDTLTAKVIQSPDSERMGDELFKVEVTDADTGAYKVTLLSNVLHSAPEKIVVNADNYQSQTAVKITVAAEGDDNAVLNVNDGAFGITSSVDGSGQERFDEINYSLSGNTTASEVMTFQLMSGKVASSAIVELSEFFGKENGVGDERGAYELWLGNVKVQEGVFDATSTSGERLLVINGPEGGFTEIRFSALPGAEVTGSDNSDYNVKQVTFDTSWENEATVDLSYTVTDGDKDSAQGTLQIVFDDDMPRSVIIEKSLEAATPEDTFTVSGLKAGWDPSNLDPNVDYKYHYTNAPYNDTDEYYEEISWGSQVWSWRQQKYVKGDQSSYEFTDNSELKAIDGDDFDLNEIFQIGKFTHHNNPLPWDAGVIKEAFLKIAFTVDIDGTPLNVDHTVKFQHTETENDPGYVDDIVKIVGGTEKVDITVNGVDYTLTLGFADQSGNPVSTIYTKENGDTSFNFVGKMAAVANSSVSGTVDTPFGADGEASSHGLVWNGDDDGNNVIEGEYGTLTVNGTGYDYHLSDSVNVDSLAPGTMDSFSYTLTDADGDSATSVLNIMLQNPIDPNGNV